MKKDYIKLRKIKEERLILKRNLNLYYFDRKKRDLLFKRLLMAEILINKLESETNNENSNTFKPSN